MSDVVLIGMPGSGKSSVARALAARLGRASVDLDAEIERELGMSVSRCFELYGEPAFRVKETETMIRYAGSGCVLALGGGAVQNGAAMRLLQKDGVIIYLHAEPAVLAERLRSDTTRPLLAGGDVSARLAALYAARKPLYERYADFTVASVGSPAEIAAEIAALVEE